MGWQCSCAAVARGIQSPTVILQSQHTSIQYEYKPRRRLRDFDGAAGASAAATARVASGEPAPNGDNAERTQQQTGRDVRRLVAQLHLLFLLSHRTIWLVAAIWALRRMRPLQSPEPGLILVFEWRVPKWKKIRANECSRGRHGFNWAVICIQSRRVCNFYSINSFQSKRERLKPICRTNTIYCTVC